ncbi:MAG: lipase/acyltransferase domain-containing protein [Nitrospiraceae bacterium]
MGQGSEHPGHIGSGRKSAGGDIPGSERLHVPPEPDRGPAMSVCGAVTLALMVWLSVGCGGPVPVSRAGQTIETAIIVVPGYYGTKLVRASDGDGVWLHAWEALFGKRSLKLPLPGLGFDGAIDLRPDGILKQVSVVPLLYSVGAYGDLLDTLDTRGVGVGYVVPLPYDWRLDLMKAVRELDALIERLRAGEQTRIAIVAHSMGGLITAYYLRYGAQDPGYAVENWEGAAKIDVVVMAGVPFQGSMTQFRNAQYGVQLGLNRVLLEPQAVSSFPATDADMLITPAGEPLKGLIRKGSLWREYGWGLLNDSGSLSAEIVARRVDYTSTWLRQAGRFSELLLAPRAAPVPKLAPLLYLFGKGHPTLATGVWLRRNSSTSDARLLFNEEHFKKYLPSVHHDILFQDGDGSVTVQSSSLPAAYGAAFQVTTKEYGVSHEKLASAPEALNEIVEFLARQDTDAGSVR